MTEIETASERGNTNRRSGRGRSRLLAEEPDVGLDPRTRGSRHPGASKIYFFLKILFIYLRERESTSRGSSRGRGRIRLPTEQRAR